MKAFIFIVFLLSQIHAKEIVFPPKEEFLFGIANAPVQVEDQLDDVWMKHARQGKVAAFSNQAYPEKKLEFWTKPEIEINLAAELGVDVFRLGVDWSRLVKARAPLIEPIIDIAALARYQQILKMIKAKKMKVMLTLFHHAEPEWTLKQGSWQNFQMKDSFVSFAKIILPSLLPDIDYLITFNEPQVYIALTQLSTYWPTNLSKAEPLGLFNLGFKDGRFETSLNHIAMAHNELYEWIKEIKPALPVGIAHNVANYEGYQDSIVNRMSAKISWRKMNDLILDKIIGHIDFMGLNYYGVEKVKLNTVVLDPTVEYSDSGRGMSPAGLYKIVHHFNLRYKSYHLPFFITENGVADANDSMRPAYLIEHLRVVRQLMDEGISFMGYIHWTLTDNFEWADGYCPKFGLVSVDRKTGRRIKRDSFEIYKKIIISRTITDDDQISSWKRNISHKGQLRPSCRNQNGVDALDVYRYENFKGIDWRF